MAQILDTLECSAIASCIGAFWKYKRSAKYRVRYSRDQIRESFAPYKAQKKDAIARVIAERFTEFAPRLPPFRKDWMSEDQRMALFDALALVFTYYSEERLKIELADRRLGRQ